MAVIHCIHCDSYFGTDDLGLRRYQNHVTERHINRSHLQTGFTDTVGVLTVGDDGCTIITLKRASGVGQ